MFHFVFKFSFYDVVNHFSSCFGSYPEVDRFCHCTKTILILSLAICWAEREKIVATSSRFVGLSLFNFSPKNWHARPHSQKKIKKTSTGLLYQSRKSRGIFARLLHSFSACTRGSRNGSMYGLPSIGKHKFSRLTLSTNTRKIKNLLIL